jgi:ribonuclease R
MEKLPTKDQVRAWIAENPTLTAKRDIARAFGIKGGALRIELKRLLRELEDEGTVTRTRRTFRDAGSLPPVSILEVLEPDAQGDLYARPLEWTGEGTAPRVLVVTASPLTPRWGRATASLRG